MFTAAARTRTFGRSDSAPHGIRDHAFCSASLQRVLKPLKPLKPKHSHFEEAKRLRNLNAASFPVLPRSGMTNNV
jgi:hypothetical protein